MLIDLEKEKKNFENHEATFQDLGNIKILDFRDRIPVIIGSDFCSKKIIIACISLETWVI